MVSILLALDYQLKLATGPGPRYDHRHGTCHAWHARHWWNSRICRWAWSRNVGDRTRPSKSHCCFLLPCVSIQLACDDPFSKKVTCANGRIPLRRNLPSRCV